MNRDKAVNYQYHCFSPESLLLKLIMAGLLTRSIVKRLPIPHCGTVV